MIAAIIFALSCVTLAEFFVSYCRSQITESKLTSLAQDTIELAGVCHRSVPGSEFKRLTRLARLCPAGNGDRGSLRAIRVYYATLSCVEVIVRLLAPGRAGILDREKAGCAYFAAAALDRRIAFSRAMYAQQMASSGI